MAWIVDIFLSYQLMRHVEAGKLMNPSQASFLVYVSHFSSDYNSISLTAATITVGMSSGLMLERGDCCSMQSPHSHFPEDNLVGGSQASYS